MADKFPAEVTQAVEGLTWLGYLTDNFEFCGHRFSLRTLYGHEELLASLLCKEYEGTLGQAKAWVWAQLALALTSIDGNENFCPPIGPDEMDFARGRFNYLTKKWFWPLAEFVFDRYVILQQRQVEAMKAHADLSNRSLRDFSPLPGSLKTQGTSTEPMPTDDPS